MVRTKITPKLNEKAGKPKKAAKAKAAPKTPKKSANGAKAGKGKGGSAKKGSKKGGAKKGGPIGGLSERGMRAQAPCRPDMKYIFEAMDDLYHPDTNPAGYLSMLVAGNKTNLKSIAAKFQEVAGSKPMPSWVF